MEGARVGEKEGLPEGCEGKEVGELLGDWDGAGDGEGVKKVTPVPPKSSHIVCVMLHRHCDDSTRQSITVFYVKRT